MLIVITYIMLWVGWRGMKLIYLITDNLIYINFIKHIAA